MADKKPEPASGRPAGAALPSYQQWIALPAHEQQRRRAAARARYDELDARLYTLNTDENLDEVRRLSWEIGMEEYNLVPYDAATISYREWAALPEDERDQVTLALEKRAVELQRRYPSMSDAEREAYEAEHRELVEAFIEERAHTGSEITGDVAIGKGHLIDVLDGYPIKPQPPLRYDPAALSYKQWIAMRRDEREAVLRALEQRRHIESEPVRDASDAEIAAMDEQMARLMQEVKEEVERTGILCNGTIVAGEGHVIHRDIRQGPKFWKKYRRPPD